MLKKKKNKKRSIRDAFYSALWINEVHEGVERRSAVFVE